MIYEAYWKHSEYVRLTDDEVNQCARHGIEMRRLSKARGHKDRKGLVIEKEEAAVRMQALGAVCEGGLFKHFGWPIDLKAQVYGVADLPGNIQVRLIGAEHYGMRVYPDDDPSWRVVGVVVLKGCERQPYRLPGWFNAGEAKEYEDWKMAPNGRPPMTVVPQKFLRPLTELRAILHSEGITTVGNRALSFS